jgi:hypothetical protein
MWNAPETELQNIRLDQERERRRAQAERDVRAGRPKRRWWRKNPD